SLDAIEVSALPDDLPPNVEVDLAALIDFGAAIHVGDLPLDHSKIDLLTPRDELVFKLTPPQRRDEELEAEAVEAQQAEEQAAAARALATDPVMRRRITRSQRRCTLRRATSVTPVSCATAQYTKAWSRVVAPLVRTACPLRVAPAPRSA